MMESSKTRSDSELAELLKARLQMLQNLRKEIFMAT